MSITKQTKMQTAICLYPPTNAIYARRSFRPYSNHSSI